MSTRVIVKKLPKKDFNLEKKLRELFAPYGRVTDVRLLEKNGKFRHMAFVGFADADAAAAAVDKVNGAFIGTSRVEVAPAVAVGASRSLPRAWSKHTEGTSAWKRAHPEAVKAEKDAAEAARVAADRAAAHERAERERHERRRHDRFDSFVKALRPEGALDVSYVETNARVAKAEAEADAAAAAAAAAAIDAADSDSDSEVFDAAGGAAESDSDDSDYSDSSSEEDINAPAFGRRRRHEAVRESLMGDEAIIDDDASTDDQSEAEAQAEPKTEPKTEPKAEPDAEAAKPTHTGRIFLRNLDFELDATALREWADALLVQAGAAADVADAHVVRDPGSRRGAGTAFIRLASPEQTSAALAVLDRAECRGRLVHAMPAAPGADDDDAYRNPADVVRELTAHGTSYKAAKRAADKKFAVQNTRAWSVAGAVSADTVAAGLAGEIGAGDDKLAVAGAANADASVALALGGVLRAEQTTEWLREHADVNLAAAAALSRAERSAAPRSDRILLLKGLPADVTEAAIRDRLNRFPGLVRLALPPGGGVALAEYDDAGSARACFRKLALTSIGRSRAVLKMEFVPLVALAGVGPDEREGAAEQAARGPVGERVPVHLSGWIPGSLDSAALQALVRRQLGQPRQLPDGTVLPAVGTARLLDVSVASKRGPDGTPVEQPYGFANFSSLSAAQAAVALLAGRPVGKRKLAAELAGVYRGRGAGGEAGGSAVEQRGESQDAFEARAAGRRLIVRNVPFNATKDELRKLFSGIGQLAALRCPMKPDRSLRGFVYVEYASSDEAARAIERLRMVTLRGRNLKPEWERGSGAGAAAGAARARSEFGVGAVAAQRQRTAREAFHQSMAGDQFD